MKILERRGTGYNQQGDLQKGYTLIECDCGKKIKCEYYTNTCPKCGADYNFAGTRLRDRKEWGEETGENWSEFIRADRDQYGGDLNL